VFTSRHYRKKLRKMPLGEFTTEIEHALEICSSLPLGLEHSIQQLRTAQGKTRVEFLKAQGIAVTDMDGFHALEHVLSAELMMLMMERIHKMGDAAAPQQFRVAFEKCIALAKPILPAEIIAGAEVLLDMLD